MNINNMNSRITNNTFDVYLAHILFNLVEKIEINRLKNNYNIQLRSPLYLKSAISILKLHTLFQFVTLSDYFGIDFLGRQNDTRFRLVCIILSLRYNTRFQVFFNVEERFIVNSLSYIYPAAGWLEREIFDMFGVLFRNSAKELRRILTDYGFEGYPLRKDFPLTGFVEVRYDDSLKRIVYEALELTQEFRFFELQTSWGLFESESLQVDGVNNKATF